MKFKNPGINKVNQQVIHRLRENLWIGRLSWRKIYHSAERQGNDSMNERLRNMKDYMWIPNKYITGGPE